MDAIPLNQSPAAPVYWQRTIPAGGNAQIDGVGDFFYLLRVSSTALEALTQVEIAQAGTQEYFTLTNGQGLRIKRGFSGLYIKNPQAYPVTVNIVYGYEVGGGIMDNALQIVSNLLQSVIQSVDKRTLTVAHPANTIAATTTISFPGTPPAGTLYRRSIQVTNGDNTQNLELWDSLGNRLAIIFPQTSYNIDTSDRVDLRNPSGSIIQIGVAEIWYRA